MASKGHQIHGNTQAVAVNGQILLSHSGYPHKCIRVAHHGVYHVLNDRFDIFKLQPIPSPDVFGDTVQQIVSAFKRVRRCANFHFYGCLVFVDAQLNSLGDEGGTRYFPGWAGRFHCIVKIRFVTIVAGEHAGDTFTKVAPQAPQAAA